MSCNEELLLPDWLSLKVAAGDNVCNSSWAEATSSFDCTFGTGSGACTRAPADEGRSIIPASGNSICSTDLPIPATGSADAELLPSVALLSGCGSVRGDLGLDVPSPMIAVGVILMLSKALRPVP